MLLQRWQLLALYACVLTALAWPVLWVDIPVGVDTLNHFARINVRAHIDTDPDLARLFEVRNVLVPYLAMDWLLTPFARVMSTLTLARVFTVALVWGLVGATAVLQRSLLGRWGWEPLSISLVAWNGLLAWGFLSYVLGIIFALLGLAAWNAGQEWRWYVRLVVTTLISTGLYLTHLLAFMAFALLIVIFILLPPARSPFKQLCLLGASFSPLAVLFLYTATPPPIGDLFIYSMQQKLLGFLTPFLFSGFAGGYDNGYAVAICIVLVALALSFFHSGTVLPISLRTSLVVAVIGLVLPDVISGVYGISTRLPLICCCVVVSGLTVRFCSKRGASIFVAVMLTLLFVRIADVAATMQKFQESYSQARAELEIIPRGSIVVAFLNRTQQEREPYSSIVFEHVAQLVTIERSGYATGFFNQLGSVRGRNPANSFALPSLGSIRAEHLIPHAYILMVHLGQSWDLPPGARRILQGTLIDLLALP